MKLSLMLLIAVLMAPLLGAQDEEPAQEEQKTEGDLVRERFAEVGDVIDSVTIQNADVDAFIEHYASFQTAMAGDAKYAELKAENWKKGFEHAIECDAFDTWQTAAGIDGQTWLRKSLRIQAFYVRDDMTESMENGRKAVKSSRERIESARDMLPEAEYEESLQSLKETEAMLDDLETAAQTLPEPAEVEARVLEDRREDLEEALSE